MTRFALSSQNLVREFEGTFPLSDDDGCRSDERENVDNGPVVFGVFYDADHPIARILENRSGHIDILDAYRIHQLQTSHRISPHFASTVMHGAHSISARSVMASTLWTRGREFDSAPQLYGCASANSCSGLEQSKTYLQIAFEFRDGATLDATSAQRDAHHSHQHRAPAASNTLTMMINAYTGAESDIFLIDGLSKS